MNVNHLLTRAGRVMCAAIVTASLAASVTGAQVAGVVNTGQGQLGGTRDNFWKYVPGGGTTGGALPGAPAVVVSEGNLFSQWALRSITPNLDRGWIASSDAVQTDAPLEFNTMQLFFNLAGYDLSTVQLGGTFWADDCAFNIFVNSTPLSGFARKCSGDYITGVLFDITQANGLHDGMNQLDFVYFKLDPVWDGIRVDFTTNLGQTNTVPEPSSMALLVTGLAGLVPMVRRRRRK